MQKTHTLKRPLTEKQKIDLANHAADLHNKLSEAKIHRSIIEKQFKVEVKTYSDQIAEALCTLSLGYTTETVLADVKNDFSNDQKVITVLDTGETFYEPLEED